MPPKASGTLSDIDKGRALALYEDGQKISQLAKKVERPWTTVGDFIRRCNERGTHENLKKVWKTLQN
jgi:transposase